MPTLTPMVWQPEAAPCAAWDLQVAETCNFGSYSTRLEPCQLGWGKGGGARPARGDLQLQVAGVRDKWRVPGAEPA